MRIKWSIVYIFLMAVLINEYQAISILPYLNIDMQEYLLKRLVNQYNVEYSLDNYSDFFESNVFNADAFNSFMKISAYYQRFILNQVKELRTKQIKQLIGIGMSTRMIASRLIRTQENFVNSLDWQILVKETKSGDECDQMAMLTGISGNFDAFKLTDVCERSDRATLLAVIACVLSEYSYEEDKRGFIQKWINQYNPNVDIESLALDQVNWNKIYYGANLDLENLLSNILGPVHLLHLTMFTDNFSIWFNRRLTGTNEYPLINVYLEKDEGRWQSVFASALESGDVDVLRTVIQAGSLDSDNECLASFNNLIKSHIYEYSSSLASLPPQFRNPINYKDQLAKMIVTLNLLKLYGMKFDYAFIDDEGDEEWESTWMGQKIKSDELSSFIRRMRESGDSEEVQLADIMVSMISPQYSRMIERGNEEILRRRNP